MSSIVYKNEIIKAYKDIPIMEINDIPFGAIINRTPGELSWWPPGAGIERFGITADIPPARGIIPFQKYYFGEHSDWIYASHTLIHTFLGNYFETTSPKSRYGILTNDNLDENKVYIICMYQDAVVDTAEGRQCFYDIFNELEGTGYDYLQLVNILIHQILQWPDEGYLPILDLGRNKKVCSVTAAVCWLWFYYNYLKKINPQARRPLGQWCAERVPCCLFESVNYNNGTFKVIGRLKSGLLD